MKCNKSLLVQEPASTAGPTSCYLKNGGHTPLMKKPLTMEASIDSVGYSDGTRSESGRSLAKVGWAARITFIMMASLGFFNVYAMRANLSIAIISMTKPRGAGAGHSAVCRPATVPDLMLYQDAPMAQLLPFADNDSSAIIHEEIAGSATEAAIPLEGEFDWDEVTQGLVLASFFWGYIVTQIPGGILVRKYGSKWMLGAGCLCTAVFSLLTPIAARYSVSALMAVRVMEGLGEGVTFPAMHALIAKWAPPSQRSTFSAMIYGGATGGLVFSMPVAGILAQSAYGWPSIFYVFGAIGVAWFVFWTILVYEDPDCHPWISHSERQFIKDAIGQGVRKQHFRDVPYKEILKSMPFWAILVAHCGQNWGFYMLLTQLPTYMRNVLGFDVKTSGFISALPYLLMYIFGLVGSALADWLRSRGLVSTTMTRKISTSGGFMFSGVCLFVVSYLGCNLAAVVAFISLAVGAIGLKYSGFSVNHIDIAPNYAGVLIGFTNCAATLPGIIAPYVTGLVLQEGETIESWRIVFSTSSAIFFCSAIFYAIFASGEEQPWNIGMNCSMPTSITSSRVTTLDSSEVCCANKGKLVSVIGSSPSERDVKPGGKWTLLSVKQG